MITLAPANICSAFTTHAIGSRIKPLCLCTTQGKDRVFGVIAKAIAAYDFPANGQGFIICPELIPFVESGDAPKSADPADYVLRSYRGEVQKFLRREYAKDVKVNFCALVVYTKEAYLVDPDVSGDEAAGIPRDEAEIERIKSVDATHVIVAVLASGGPKPTVSPHRFVMNLAGGNHDYVNMTGDELRSLAVEIKSNVGAGWCTVAC